MVTDTTSHDDRIENGYLVRMHGNAWGFALGTLLALGLFAATNILVLKGGDDVGQHLGLLANYFPGYDVAFFPGSFIGAFYAFAIGYLTGRIVCGLYNLAARR